MNEATYRKTRVGARVRTRVDLHNGWGIIPAGTIMTVEYKRGGFSLVGPTCECCGLAPSISRVRPERVDWVADDA